MHDLKSKLNGLKKLEPNTAWKQKQWDLLQSEIKSPHTQEFGYWQKVEFLFTHPALLKPVGNFIAIALVFGVGAWAALATVQNSMPDNFLYSAKVTLEKVEVALTVDNKAKVSKQTDLARKRVGELQYLIAASETPITSLHVDKTVKNIRQNLSGAQADLSRLNAQNENNDFSKTVEAVEKSANTISQGLKETSSKLPAGVQVSVSQDLEDAVEQVSDIGAQAFELLIQDWLSDDNVPENQIVEKLTAKLAELVADKQELQIEDWLEKQLEDNERVAQVTEIDSRINESFIEFKKLIAEKDYLGGLALIKTIRQDIKNLNKALTSEVLGTEEVLKETDLTTDEKSDIPVVSETSSNDVGEKFVN